MNQNVTTGIIAAAVAVAAGAVTFAFTDASKTEARAATFAAPPVAPAPQAQAEPKPIADFEPGQSHAEPGSDVDVQVSLPATSGSEDIHTMAWLTKAKTKQAVLDLLNDPRSAQFRRVGYTRFENGAAVICGEVNAKNAMGGYGEFLPFYGTDSWATIFNGSPSWEMGFRRNCLDKPVEGAFSDF